METRGLYIARNSQELAGFVRSLNRNLDDIQVLLNEWDTQATPAEKPRLETIETEAAPFIALRRQVSLLASQGKLTDAETLSTSNRTDRITFQNTVEALVSSTRADLDTAKASAANYSHHRAGDFLLTALVGILVIFALSYWIVAHFITSPLKAIASAIIKTSKGEYDLPLAETRGEDEVSSVWRALAVLKERAQEAERLAAARAEAEHEKELKLREILLD